MYKITAGYDILRVPKYGSTYKLIYSIYKLYRRKLLFSDYNLKIIVLFGEDCYCMKLGPALDWKYK